MAVCTVCAVNFTPQRGHQPRRKFANGFEEWWCPACDLRERRDRPPPQRLLYEPRVGERWRVRIPGEDQDLTFPLPTPPTPGRVEPIEPAQKTPFVSGKAKIELLGKAPGPPPKTRLDLLAEGGFDVEGEDE